MTTVLTQTLAAFTEHRKAVCDVNTDAEALQPFLTVAASLAKIQGHYNISLILRTGCSARVRSCVPVDVYADTESSALLSFGSFYDFPRRFVPRSNWI